MGESGVDVGLVCEQAIPKIRQREGIPMRTKLAGSLRVIIGPQFDNRLGPSAQDGTDYQNKDRLIGLNRE